MLSKLTFSLVLVLMCAFVATSAFGQVSADLNDDGDTATAADADMIAADGFVVYEKTGTPVNGLMDAVAQVTAADAATFPDIEDLLRRGGTIELAIGIEADGTVEPDTEVLGDTDPDSAGVQIGFITSLSAEAAYKLKHRLIISEIMWGRNRTADSAADQASQWIEIHNTGGALKAVDNVYLVFSNTKQNRLGTSQSIDVGGTATPVVIVDSVSLVNNFGSFWAPKGNGGNSGTVGPGTLGADQVLPSALNSMYRKVNLDAGKYKKHDTNVLDGLGMGTEAGSWEKSAGAINMMENFIGSPGSVHVQLGGVVTKFDKKPAAIPPTHNLGTSDAPKNLDPGSGVIINEVRNDTSSANLDWIELFNNTDPAPAGVTSTNVENWELSIVTRMPKAGKTEADDPTGDNFDYKDEELAVLPKYKLAPGEYMVIYNRDPGDTGLAGGVHIDAVANRTNVNKGASHVYTVSANLNLPSDKMFLIILRNGNDKNSSPDKVVDYAGNGYFARVEANKFDTEVWPFVGWTAPGDQAAVTDNTFASADMTWGRKTELGHAVGTADPKEAAKRASTHLNRGVYWPKSREGNRMHKDDWLMFGFMGTGYDRGVNQRTSPGTPGYANVAVNILSDDRAGAANHEAYAFSGAITISEVMYDAGPRWNLVQWIELYNSSMSETIDLSGWRLEIRNKEDVESYVDSDFIFNDEAEILPNQTLLLVSGSGTNDVDAKRVYNLYQHHRQRLGLLARDSILLSRTGFYLNLQALVNQGGRTVWKTIDEAGNVTVEGAQRTVMWELPARDPAARQSLLRQYGTRAIDGTPDMADDGTMESSWRQSDITGAGLAYYGHRNDISTPGYRLGGPLPVSLSSFRPVRNETTGHVDIQWITQSELNNAGFNILRSEGKGSEFKVINVKGIVPGHGTTSEKHVYTFTDTTAKPNVVYYYQIEDVSLDGKRTTLRTTHLRGNVSASGKLTTTWGDLKLQK